MYKAVEDFSRDLACEEITLLELESVKKEGFWQSRGFVPSDKAGKEGMLEKSL